MALFGSVPSLRTQLARPDHFAAAFHYLEQALDPDSEVARRIRAVPVGESQRVELPGGAFALEQVYLSKPRETGRFEAHRAYIDLQAMVEGEESIDVMDVGRLRVQDDFAAGGDVAFFHDEAGASCWRMRAGEVAVFFPVDAHKPSLAVDGPARVCKTVVKVPVPA
jgi:biofilm protein TabA